MALPTATHHPFSEDLTWDSLKRAIASSSGFQRWRDERTEDVEAQDSMPLMNQEQLVSRYLRETLETLAY